MSKKNKKNKNTLDDIQIEEIIRKTNVLISRLNADKKKYFWNIKKTKLINNQINDLNLFLKEEQYYLLKSKLDLLEEMENKEKKEIESINENEKVWSFFSFEEVVNNIKNNDRWPIYTRVLNIIKNNDKKGIYTKLAILISLILFLLSISLIGILMIANVIPYFSSSDPNLVGPWFIVAMPIMILFFI